MAKAWRNEAARKINEQRVVEYTLTGAVRGTPTARQQARIKHRLPSVQGAGNWLLAGLMIRGGYQAALPGTLKTHLHEDHVPLTDGFAKRLGAKFRKLARWAGI